MTDFHSFLQNINQLISNKNGVQLAKALSLPILNKQINHNDAQSLDSLINRLKKVNVMIYCNSNVLDQSLSNLVGHRTEALIKLYENNLEEAYTQEHSAYTLLLEAFSSKDENTNWLIPVLVKLSNDMRFLAEMADDKIGGDYKNLRDCLNSLTRGFTIVAKDRTPVTQEHSKKHAIFAVSNVLFKVYFKLNTLQLCGKLINVVEGPGGIMDYIKLFPVSDVVMYKYYIGRLKMFEDKYEEARECLRFAYKYTPKNFIQNRRKILASLAPIEMCLGVIPTKDIADTYGLNEMYLLGQSIKHGDIKLFDQIISANQKSFIKLGIYLVLEQAKAIAYRSLYKRISLIIGSTRLNLVVIQKVMEWLDESIDLDEIECILSNLIYKNQIKGYLSHQKRFLIISKADAFPTNSIIKKSKNI